MTPSRALLPLAAALVGLAGALAVTLFLHRSAVRAVDRVFEERLRGAGETAARLIGRSGQDAGLLRAVMDANQLEGAYLLSRELLVLADATGPAGEAPDLLRVDSARAARALAGETTVDFAYAVGDVRVASGYFPVRGVNGAVTAVLALEAGQAFTNARTDLGRALWTGVGLSLLGALALGALALQWTRGEEQRRLAASSAARGDAMTRMAAMAAHEIRNPIGVIRAAVELVRARSGSAIGPRDQEALADVLGEVERLKRLTEDFLDLTRDPVISGAPLDLTDLAGDTARALARTHPALAVEVRGPSLPVEGDPGRLRQVLTNLLLNAAQAGARRVEISGSARDGAARLEITDDGPGVDPSLRERLFEPFATGRKDGTGLGLAIARRIAERHGGELTLAAAGPPGARFDLRLPLRIREEG